MTSKRFHRSGNTVWDKEQKIPITKWSNIEQANKSVDELNGMEDTINSLTNSLQRELEEKVQLRETYNRETSFLVRENVKLKDELITCKKEIEELLQELLQKEVSKQRRKEYDEFWSEKIKVNGWKNG